MNNLTPEPRADVNGKVTTRWVRNTPASVNKSQFVPPPLPPVHGPQSITAEAAPLFTWVMKQVFPQHVLRVDEVHPLAVKRIEAMLDEARKEDGGPIRFGFVQGALITTLHEARDTSVSQGPSTRNRLIHDFAVFGADNSGHDLAHLQAGLRKRHEFRHVNDFLLDLPPEGLERAIALFKVTSSISMSHLDMNVYDDYDKGDYTTEELDEYVMLKSDDLANFVMDNPQLSDDVIRIIRERKSSDADMIREVLTSEAPALGSGAL